MNDLHRLVRGDVHVIQNDVIHQHLRQSDNLPGDVPSNGSNVADADMPPDRRAVVNWMRRILFGMSRNLGIPARDQNGIPDVFHREILISEILSDSASATGRFQSDARLGAVKRAISHEHVSHAAARFAADRHAMSVKERAIGNKKVFAREIFWIVSGRAFDGDVVVAGIERASCDHKIDARGIDSVGVGRI